jgi:hypothetical protein
VSHPPRFLSEMSNANLDWVLETVRTPLDATPDAINRKTLANYLKNYAEAMRLFDAQFRAGLVSKDLRKTLKDQHEILVKGTDKNEFYVGSTSTDFQGKEVLQSARNFIYEDSLMSLRLAQIFLVAPWMHHQKGPWTGPGRGAFPVPPPDLLGPFPRPGETWHLWFPEIAERATAKKIDPHLVMPKNSSPKARGPIVRHTYPRFYYQKYYLDRMSDIMVHIENCILRTHPSTPLHDVLILVADYYQVGINAHLFYRVNNSLLMNQVNYFLHMLGLRGIPHGHLDYLALYKIPTDFRSIFIDAVKERNPGIESKY